MEQPGPRELAFPRCHGQTEGQVNELTLLKRQMHGRVSFDLLRRRVLQPARGRRRIEQALQSWRQV